MNKLQLILATSIFLLFTSINSMHAQHFNYGLGIGIDVAKIHSPKLNNTEAIYTYTPMLSYNLNGFITYNFSSEWSITAEPGYMRKGTAIKFTDYPPNTYVVVHSPQIQHHIQLPISVNYTFTENLLFNIGPEISYLIDDTQISSVRLPTTKLELSGSVGITHKINDSFGLGLQYNHGITPINLFGHKDANSNYDGTLNEYNQYLQLMVRYTI